MQFSHSGCISPDHPALHGHFPDYPIVPGVVLLTELMRALEAGAGQAVRALEFQSVKFTAPLRPAQPYIIRVETADASQLKFTATSNETTIASGIIRYAGL